MITRTYNNFGIKLVKKNIIRKRGSIREGCTSYYDSIDNTINWDTFKKVVSKQLKKPNPIIVPVHKFNSKVHKNGNISYYYDMSKCDSLNEEEAIIIDRWGAYGSTMENSYDIFPKSINRSKYNKLFKFLAKVSKIAYNDLHSGNVMKFKNKYVLIDLEGF